MTQIWHFKCVKCDKESEHGLNHGDEKLLNLLRHADEIKSLLDSDKSKCMEISIMNSGTELVDFLVEHYGSEHCVVVYSEYGDIIRADGTKEKRNRSTVKNMKKQFELKEEHLKLLKNMRVRWNDSEFGAPAIDCKKPYGNSDVHEDMAKILGIEGFEDSNEEIHFYKGQIELVNKLHKETMVTLQIVLITGKFEPGTYVADEYSDNWQRENR